MAECIERQAVHDAVSKLKRLAWQSSTTSPNVERCVAVELDAVHAAVDRIPAADVVERKPLREDVEELIGMMRDYAKDCASGGDMCASCQFSYFCEDGWTPDAISDKLVELANQATERKAGKWIDGKCNQCGANAPFWPMASTYYESNFCPNCGAQMIGGEDK